MDYKGSIGEIKAQEVLNDFISDNLNHYHDRNDPSLDFTSHLSKYIKYGFISPVQIINQVHASQKNNQDLFIEELVVRRELAINFCYYNEGYDQFDQMTYEWAYKTMKVHETDEREYLYTTEDYLSFNTHDPYFNAAMKEMVYFGYMHNYMRMYWAKKIIEWSYTYKEAFEISLFLNNTYFYDGNTPNGYAGVAWCFGKHDRAWTERKIFGKLRYMNSNGLKRKFDIETYVSHIEEKVAMLDE
jgi:deoxyribodipyrimidine photo-lyase